MTLTHDPTQPLYTIAITRPDPWPDADVFSLSFANGLTISTPNHALTDGGRTLQVADRGFGNVIVGFFAEGMATARLGNVEEQISLDGAAEPTRAYAACAPLPTA